MEALLVVLGLGAIVVVGLAMMAKRTNERGGGS